jgi:hypothetical protein
MGARLADHRVHVQTPVVRVELKPPERLLDGLELAEQAGVALERLELAATVGDRGQGGPGGGIGLPGWCGATAHRFEFLAHRLALRGESGGCFCVIG